MSNQHVFKGRVDQIVDGIAYVTMTESTGEVSYAEIEESKLSECGIHDHDVFKMEIADENIVFTKFPPRVLTANDIAEVRKKLDELLPDSILDDDKL